MTDWPLFIERIAGTVLGMAGAWWLGYLHGQDKQKQRDDALWIDDEEE